MDQMALLEKLEKLAELRAKNILTEEEFTEQKRILLSSFDGSHVTPQAEENGNSSSQSSTVGINLAQSWREKFKLIEIAAPLTLFGYKNVSHLSFSERFRISFNIFGFLFGPIYYFYLGMHKKGLAMIGGMFVAGIIFILVENLTGMKIEARFVGIGLSALVGSIANYDYYLFKVKSVEMWSWFPFLKQKWRAGAFSLISFLLFVILALSDDWPLFSGRSNAIPHGEKVPGVGSSFLPSPAKPTSPLPPVDDATAVRDQATTSVPAAIANEKKGRPAQCLLEVKGVHYLGGPCIFIPLDKLGSFRITDVQGINLVAQVNSSKKDEGKAVWNGPLGGNSPTKELGEAYRSGGCWTASDSEPGKYEDSRICAWGLKDRVYLGPSPRTPDPSSIVYYGSRVGMYEEIASREGLDTRNARIVAKPSKDGAVTFCREYSRDYSMKCIYDQMRDQTVSTLRGNCQDKTFADANGNRYAFLGKAPKGNDEIAAEFSIRDSASGEILDGSSASGYHVRLGIYQALCPSSAPKSSE